MQTSHKSIVVLDANAFISMTNITQLGIKKRLVTTADVILQLKDAKTKAYLNEIPFGIEELNCDAKSLIIVKQFANKTGDIGTLSDVDLQLLALAHTLYVQYGLQSKLNKQPLPLIQQQDLRNIAGEQSLSESSDQEATTQEHVAEQSKVEVHKQIKEPKLQISKQVNTVNQEDNDWIIVPTINTKAQSQSDSASDNQQAWITPNNYYKKMAEINSIFKQQQVQHKEEQSLTISLVSSDFAIQNVAVQMGISLLSLDGRRIISIRRFIWQCYLCWKQFKITDNTIKLCTNCGYNSLSKIAFSIDGKGNMILHRKKGWKPNDKVMEWKEIKLEEQEQNKKHQHARRRKKPSIFDN